MYDRVLVSVYSSCTVQWIFNIQPSQYLLPCTLIRWRCCKVLGSSPLWSLTALTPSTCSTPPMVCWELWEHPPLGRTSLSDRRNRNITLRQLIDFHAVLDWHYCFEPYRNFIILRVVILKPQIEFWIPWYSMFIDYGKTHEYVCSSQSHVQQSSCSLLVWSQQNHKIKS